MTISTSPTRFDREIARQTSLASEVSRLQSQISTGRKRSRLSEDAPGAARAAALKAARTGIGAWQSNAAIGRSLGEQASGILSNLSQRLARAKEVMVAGVNGAYAPADRASFALELRGIADDIAALADTRSASGELLFASGAATQFRFGEAEVFAPVPARADVFEMAGRSFALIVRDAADALAAGTPAAMAASLDEVGAAVGAAADGAALLGVSLARLDSVRERLVDRNIALLEEQSALEDTDLNEAIARLNQQTITLDAARAAFARINRQTLFDLLS